MYQSTCVCKENFCFICHFYLSWEGNEGLTSLLQHSVLYIYIIYFLCYKFFVCKKNVFFRNMQNIRTAVAFRLYNLFE